MYKKLLIIALALVFVLFQDSGTLVSAAEADVSAQEAQLKGSATTINITSDEMEYLRENEQIVATGNVVIIVEKDGTRVESEKVIYDRLNEQIISEGTVKIFKDGAVMTGDYAKFNLLTNSVLIDDPETTIREIVINAKEANISSEDLTMTDGKIALSNKDMVLALSTGLMSRKNQGNNRIMQERPGVKPRLKYNIKSKEILITDTPNSKIVTLKNATIRINRYKIAHVPVMKLSAAQGGGFVTFKRDEKTGIPRLTTVATAEESSLIETTFPEFGHLSELGAFVGYGHVFDLKNGGTLKAVPLFSWGDGKRNDIGFGGMVRYMDTTNKTELYYSTLKDKILLEGEQRIFTPNTKLIYGANSYIENGFFGLQKPDYVVEIVDSRSLIKAYNFDFNLRSSGGYVESIDSNFALGRFQLQGSLRNIAPFWRYKDYLTIGAGANAHLGLYGNGATYGVARIGPHVGSTLGPLDIWAAYYQGAIGGESPLLFDRYQHGKSNVTFHSSLRVSKYLTLAYGTSLNLTKDSWEKKLMIENQVYMWVGPEDFKIKLGYDIERERTLFGIDMLVGAEDSAIDFEKLKVKQKL